MKFFLVIVGIIIALYVIIAFNNNIAELQRLEAEATAVAAQLEQRTRTIQALEAKIQFATSEAAVVRYAHENQMVRPGEIQIVPLPGDAITPTPVVVQSQPATPTPLPNWQIWVTLFFGK